MGLTEKKCEGSRDYDKRNSCAPRYFFHGVTQSVRDRETEGLGRFPEGSVDDFS